MKCLQPSLNFILILFLLSQSVITKADVEIDVREVTTKGTRTTYIGSRDREHDTISFKGIRYAQPPVGKLRWAPPKPLSEKNKTVYAFSYGDPCPQMMLPGVGWVSGNEDCLFLNIWRPAQEPKKKRPVMVFIHGGAQIIGSANQNVGLENLYDGTKLAQVGDAIVVTLNYRLGALGFLSSTSLSAESKTGTSGNYGLMDQIAALKWIKKNIAAFGGDPNNVTIFGESAGGANVLALLASPEAKGLFHKAIAQSGVLYDTELPEAERKGDDFLSSLGCAPGDLDCARKLSFRKVIKGMPLNREGEMPIGPVIDNHILKEHVLETFRKGEHNHVPLMLGTNEHEMTLLLPMFLDRSWSIDRPRFVELIVDTLGDEAFAKIDKEYTIEKYGSYRNALMALLGDHHFHLPAQQIAQAVGQSQDPGVWQYIFNHRSVLGRVTGLKAGHAMELPLLFGTLRYLWDDSDHRVSDFLMRTWSNFAWTGDPNLDDHDLPYWPEADENQVLYVSETPSVDEHMRSEECKKLLKIGKNGQRR